MVDLQVVEKLISDRFFVFCKNIFQLNSKTAQSSGAITDYEQFVLRRKNIIRDLVLTDQQLQIIQKLIRFQFILECFLEKALPEKQLQVYNDYLFTHHQKVFVSIFSNCKNLKIIFSQITNKNNDYLKLFIEYLYLIKTDNEKILATFRCLKKINFFDWIIQEIKKFKIMSLPSGCELDLRPEDWLRRKHLVSLVSLIQFLCASHGEIFLNDVFCFQEKIDNFKTLQQMVKLNFQTMIPELRPICHSVFELLIINLKKMDIKGPKDVDEKIDPPKKIFVEILRSLLIQPVSSIDNWIPLLELLMIQNETEILVALNEEAEVYSMILNNLDFKQSKLKTLKCLQIFKTLVSHSRLRPVRDYDDLVAKIYDRLAQYCRSSKRSNMFNSLFLVISNMIRRSPESMLPPAKVLQMEPRRHFRLAATD